MALSYVAAGTAVSAAGTLNVPYYAGLLAGDIAGIHVAGYIDTTFGTVSGWTAETQISTAGVRTRFYWRRLDGSESGTVAVTGATSFTNTGIMFGVRGALSSGTPYEGYATNTGSGTTVTSPATTTTVTDTILYRAYVDEGSSSAPPATWTERYEASDTIFEFGDTKNRSTTGTETATSRSGTFSEPWATFGLAFMPAPLVFVDSPNPPRRWPRIRMIGI